MNSDRKLLTGSIKKIAIEKDVVDEIDAIEAPEITGGALEAPAGTLEELAIDTEEGQADPANNPSETGGGVT